MSDRVSVLVTNTHPVTFMNCHDLQVVGELCNNNSKMSNSESGNKISYPIRKELFGAITKCEGKICKKLSNGLCKEQLAFGNL